MKSNQINSLDFKVSLFEAGFATPTGQSTPRQYLEDAKSGKYRDEVEQIRAAIHSGDEDEVVRLKKLLPTITVSGLITEGGRSQAMQENRFQHSGLLQGDFDKDGLGGSSPEQLKEQIKDDPHVVSVALSPSGRGVKAFIRIPRCKSVEEHRRAFEAAESHFRDVHGVTLDPQTKDSVRLCFVTYDPNAYIRETPALILPLASPHEKKPNPERITAAKRTDKDENVGWERKWGTDEAAEMLDCIPRPGRGERDKWLRIASGIWDHFGEIDGTALLQAWDSEWERAAYAKAYSGRLDQIGIGSVIMLAKEGGWNHPRNTSECVWQNSCESENDGFPIIHADEMGETSEPLDFVEDLLTDGAASVVYGPSNCGKTFWISDLGVAVATGEKFGGEIEVERGAVIYVALEGASGVRNRIAALKRSGRLPKGSPFFLCFSPFSLMEPGAVEKLVASVKSAAARSNLRCRLVILDTLSRAMAGADENSGKDMTFAVMSIDAIRAATEAHVCVVHHCGKDEARGARGHSSLRAAVDTEIEITRDADSSVTIVTVKKQRDLVTRQSMAFSLEPINLGVSRRGKPITSCVVRHLSGYYVPKRTKGRPVKTSDSELLRLLPQGSTTAWQVVAESELGIKRSAFYELLKSIKKAEMAVCDEKGEWQARIQFPNQLPDDEPLIP
jgi:hypothetical protein